MLIKLFYTSLLLMLSGFVLAKQSVSGTVTDMESGKAIVSASIFLNNTSIGTKTDNGGKFQLYAPQGRFELIVSCIGYETHSQLVGAADTGLLTIRLKPKAAELETVVIEPFEKNGWEKWGSFFLESFIGTSAQAGDCRLKNPQVLRFRNRKSEKELTAHALEPLIVENKALGYTIHYQLESFSYNFKTRYLSYTGYPFFIPMKGNVAKEKRWKEKREEVYRGSLMHFMRTIYRNTLAAEGFEVRRLKKVDNEEKQRVKAAYAKNIKAQFMEGKQVMASVNKDTADYYDKILRQRDQNDIIGKDILPGDSIAYAEDSTTVGLDFPDYVLVIYKHAATPREYRTLYPESSTAQMSQLNLLNFRPVFVEASGSYYSPTDLIILGYWSWSEKMATMLPFDYQTESRPQVRQ
ncbi:MAG TPA: carboxypeptidase-like regulatory domain-containing protein [Flavisolibacter sp.]|nr:carboxypeptidase-like regulatory domain-containing protein [Flavisolibacter sp.]